jgi:hypothetical protein
MQPWSYLLCGTRDNQSPVLGRKVCCPTLAPPRNVCCMLFLHTMPFSARCSFSCSATLFSMQLFSYTMLFLRTMLLQTFVTQCAPSVESFLYLAVIFSSGVAAVSTACMLHWCYPSMECARALQKCCETHMGYQVNIFNPKRSSMRLLISRF